MCGNLVKSRKIEVIPTYDRKNKSALHLPWQEVAFLKKDREIKDCGSLREDFYTEFKPIFYELGL